MSEPETPYFPLQEAGLILVADLISHVTDLIGLVDPTAKTKHWHDECSSLLDMALRELNRRCPPEKASL